jgi:DNA-binding response OmpR family regulator/DNA-binding CsgD family transcriptional regulator
MMHVKKPADIVLVVDDSPDQLSMITDALEESGMTVLVAVEGVQALSMLDRITPDVILMDAVMPGLDGFETCRKVKQAKSIAHIPIIFMTGLSESEHIVKGFEAGGVDYVTKPITPDELLARIRVHLANARLAQSAQAALDASGRHLLAASKDGRVLWHTPQAAKLLRAAFATFDSDLFVLPAEVRAWLAAHAGGDAAAPDLIPLAQEAAERKLRLSYVGMTGADEFLLRLVDEAASREEIVLKDRLALTLREAEVLSWIARGKSNRDIAEILELSPRTVNKHLEQIYAKLGVENRTAAAALAMRALASN